MIRSLTLRILAIYLPLDLFFSTALCFAHLGLFDLEHAGPYMVAFAALWPFRFFGWAVLVASSLKPVSALALAGRRATDQEVATAEEALRRGRSRLPVIYGLGWFTHLALATLYMAWLYPEPEAVSAYSLEASLLLVLGVLAGALVFAVPLFLVLTNGEATSLSLESQMRGIEPRIGQSSLQHRITALALGLGIAPTLFVASLGYSSAGLAELELLGRDATSAALELAAAAAGEERVPPVEERHRAGAVMRRAEGITGPVAALASSSPVLAKALEDAVRQGKALSRVDRGAGVAIAAAPVDGDRVAVAVLRTSRERVSSFLIAAVAFVLTVLAWAPISAAMFSRSITVPIAQLTAAARKLVEDGRFSELRAVPVITDDDVGRLGVDFNHLLGLLRSLSDVSREIASGRLDVRVPGVGDLPEAFRNMTESLRSVVQEMSETSLQLGAAATEIFAATQEQEMAATTQSSSMREISQTMESLSESAAHVAEAVEGVLENAERTVETTERMVTRIGELNAHAGRIGEILEVIREIADRSDLLALNGALEASHAGEAGRGFALVAAEMRRLAERVTASVKDVRGLVEDIRQSGSSTVMATEESKKLAMLTSEAARKITLVTQQQRSSTEQVSEGVRELTDVVSQSVAATSQTRASSETLKDRADRLAQIVRRFRLDGEERG